jgi:hypothetical protein
MFVRKKNPTDDYQDYVQVGGKTSYPDYVFAEMCDQLQSAMWGEQWTYADVKPTINKLKSNADVQKLKQTWGQRDYTGSWMGSVGGLIFPAMTLTGWFDQEGVLEDVNKLLKSKGIKELF